MEHLGLPADGDAADHQGHGLPAGVAPRANEHREEEYDLLAVTGLALRVGV